MTDHHVPPTSTARGKQFILQKTDTEHQAYHTIFGNAESYERCCEILKLYWWTKETEQLDLPLGGGKDPTGARDLEYYRDDRPAEEK